MIQGLGTLAAACAVGALACSSSDATEPTRSTQTSGGAGGRSSGGTGGQSSGGTGGRNPQECSGAPLQIFFSQMYSAFDGVHTFEVPAIVSGMTNAGVTWSADPPNLVALEKRPDLVMIRTLGAGTVTIEAQAGNRCGSAAFVISQATAAEWEAGNARYNNGVPLPAIPSPPIPPTDGSNQFEAGGARPACTNCHDQGSMAGIFKSFVFTPQQTAGFTDDELVQVMRAGVIPPGGYFNDSMISRQIWSFFHKWSLSDDEARGLVVYLRSFTPKSMGGSVDFSGIGRGTGGAGGT
jgi:hypothetical protein